MTSDPAYSMQYPNMYPNQQQYQYPAAAPQQQNSQQQPSTAAQPSALAGPASYPTQQPQQPQHAPQGQYQGYPYPQPPAPPTSAPAPPTQGYQGYPPSTYGYAPPMPGYSYYAPPTGYPTGYPPYQSTYAGSAYPTPQSNPPPQYPPYSNYGYQTNGYPNYTYHQTVPQRNYGKEKTPPQKRQRLDPKQIQTNGSHAHKRSRSITKEKNPFSDFRVLKIKVGNFEVEETRSESDTRDSKLRFYFRPSPATLQKTSNHLPPIEPDIATQYPDRLSVSLHKGTHRIVLPAAHLSSIYFNRPEGYVKVEGDGWAAFEEFVPGESDDKDKNGRASPKFTPSVNDPTNGQWEQCKVMEIWLNNANPLTVPKWARGNVKDHIDSSSLFQSILHIVDAEPADNEPVDTESVELPMEHVPHIVLPSTFDEMIESWKDKSVVGTAETKQLLISELNTPEKVGELIERAVQIVCGPLFRMVERLMALTKEKGTSLDEVKHVALLIPPGDVWRALDSMLMDEVNQTRETSTSAVSSNNHPAKREREEDKDEDMEITTASREDSIHNHIDPVAVLTNVVLPLEKATETLGLGELEYNEGMITEFHVPETPQDETFAEQLTH